MARDGLLYLVCAAFLAGATPTLAAETTSERDNKISTLLAVQKALREGRDQLQRGNYQGAVLLLESQIARVNGNPEYLAALCDAYRGYLAELRRAGRFDEIPKYQERLEILDPAACLIHKDKAPTSIAAMAGTSPISASPVIGQVINQGKPTNVFPGGGLPSHGIARAKLEEDDDPFSDANATQRQTGAAARAEEEYAKRRYEAAGKLYEQAYQAGESLSDACREHWGYCKLIGIAETLRQPNSPAVPVELEREVRKAMSLTPKLETFGNDLLLKIRDRQSISLVDTPTPQIGEAIEVKHIDAKPGVWAAAVTTNFCVLHMQSREFAERIARLAEKTRLEMCRKWFGDNPPPWNPRCYIYVYATAQDYSRETGVPTTSPGHSTMKSEGEHVLSRRIDLHCDDPNMMVGVLPHETTHVVLAGRFGNHLVPRWADEGMAVLSEPRDRIERHLHNLPQHQAEHHLFGVGQLMKLNDYPDPRYVGPFYAQSVSLVDFLSEQKGPSIFAKFLHDGLDNGYEQALQRYYGIQSFNELEQMWTQHTFNSTASAVGYGH